MSYIRKTATEVLTQIQNVFKNVFGANVTTTPSSTVGVFSQELTNIGVEVEDTRALLFSNVYDPNFASGKYLDGLCAFHQIKRNSATKSIATCNITGLSGVVIPTGSAVILNANGDQFKNTGDVTITAGVANGVVFEAVKIGAISVVANSLNRIQNTIAGFDTVTNPTDGVTGSVIESDNSLRFKRKKSLYANSSGGLRSIIGALEENNNVIDYNIYENYTLSQITNPAIIDAKALYLVVYLRDNSPTKLTEIAEILYLKKSAGCGMMGTLHQYTDPLYSWEIYNTHFDLAIQRPIEMHINIDHAPGFTANTPDKIRTAIIASFLGEDGSVPVQMRIVFSTSKFYPAIISQGVYNINSFTMNIIGEAPDIKITTAFADVATLIAANINITVVI